MKKCKYFIGCLGVATKNGDYKSIRFVTDLNESSGHKIPKFEFEKEPLEFTSEEADNVMRELIAQEWLAVTVRVPQNRKCMCYNYLLMKE